VNEERNVYEDYKKAFGEEPPMISGIPIMTGTDNTGESATAYYGDILFKRIDIQPIHLLRTEYLPIIWASENPRNCVYYCYKLTIETNEGFYG
jgi:hypothetical protein